MAEKRMLSTAIIESDAFISMSTQAQALYLHLCMNADNRGYINNARSILSMFDDINTSHLTELISNKFLLSRPKGLYLVKHWYIHNVIPNRLIDESNYIEDLENLFFDSNFAYTEKETNTEVCKTIEKENHKRKEKVKGNENEIKSKTKSKNKKELDDDELF